MLKPFTIVLASTICAAFALPAQALNTRTWISGTGVDDASCGSIATPCRTLQYAHDNTAPGGEIDVKDSAGYGSVVITQAISIVGDGAIAGVLAGAGANAITVNAGASDRIVLRGLTIEGAGVASNGVFFNSGGRLDIEGCTIQNFVGSGLSGNGIILRPTSGAPAFIVTNTNISHNSAGGLYYLPTGTPTASFVVDRLTAIDNSFGIQLGTYTISSPTLATITNSITSKNSGSGMVLSGTQLKADIDFCHSDENGLAGYFASVSATVAIGRSVGANNGANGLGNNGAVVTSYKDNRFAGNVAGPTSGTIGNATLN